MKRHHVQSKIKSLLTLSDEELEVVFDKSAIAIREEFNERLANGEVYVGSEGCEGFHPVTGCPGHEVKGGQE